MTDARWFCNRRSKRNAEFRNGDNATGTVGIISMLIILMTQTDVIRRLFHIYAIRRTILAAWHLETLRLNPEQTLTEIHKNNTYQ